MRQLLKTIIITVLTIPLFALATPVSWDYTANVLRPLSSMWTKEVKVPFLTATSTTQSSTFPLFTATNGTTTNATSTIFYTGTLGTNAEYFTDLTGTGLQNTGNALTLNATGDWTGTIDGYEGSQLLGMSNWLYNGSRLSPSTTIGIGVFASSTIGDGTATGGLTINGGATTTGMSFLQGTTTISKPLYAERISSGLFNELSSNSLAVGDANAATGTYSGALGYGNVVQSDYSYALGYLNAIYGVNHYSLIAGSNNTIALGSGGNNYAFGNNNQLGGLGQYQFVMGNANNLSNARDEAYAFGFDNTLEGFYGGAFGSQNSVLRNGAGNTPDGSNAFGTGNMITCGTVCTAIGLNNDVLNNLSVAIGSNLRASSTQTFIIGTGVDSANRLTSLTSGIYLGINSTIPTLSLTSSAGAGTFGMVGIGSTTPSRLLTVAGDIYAANITATGSLTALNATSTTSFFSGLGTFTNAVVNTLLTAASAAFTSFTSTNGTTTNATSTNLYATNISMPDDLFSFSIASTSNKFATGTTSYLPMRPYAYTVTDIDCNVIGGTSKIVSIFGENITCDADGQADDGSIAITEVAAGSTTVSYLASTTVGIVNDLLINVYGRKKYK